jgi:hypothetical protein
LLTLEIAVFYLSLQIFKKQWNFKDKFEAEPEIKPSEPKAEPVSKDGEQLASQDEQVLPFLQHELNHYNLSGKERFEV